MGNKQGKVKNKWWEMFFMIFFAFLLFVSASIAWGAKHFGNISMDEILFTLMMPLEGTGSDFINSYIFTAFVPAAFITAVAVIIRHIIRKRNAGRVNSAKKPVICIIIAVVWLAGIFTAADRNFDFYNFLKGFVCQSDFIEEEYADPESVEITFPEGKRNLIYILVESAETSAQDIENGGLFNVNYIPEMTEIAKDNISFSQSDKIEGAAVGPASAWTVAGMVGESSGLPLKHFTYDEAADGSRRFMPGMTNLGDILEENGYNNYWMIGTDKSFSGRDGLMKQHGNFEIWDYNTAIEEGKIPPDYFEWWGYEDRKLYEYAKEELTRLSEEGRPFNFTMLTADTHHVGGYVCPLCRDDYDSQYGNVWACASRQLDNFLEWIKEQPFYENTTIVICGDHCSMDPDFYSEYKNNRRGGESKRRVYNAIINAPVTPAAEKNRKFTTLDMFPTALAAIGADIEGERLGLGTNLFSEEETLSEKYGYEYYFDEVGKKSDFYTENILFDKGKQ